MSMICLKNRKEDAVGRGESQAVFFVHTMINLIN